MAEWPRSTSLPELREALSSPGLIQAEVDALFAAIARPPAGDETLRARADFLLSLMELPEEARDRKGSDGRTVRAAAVEALMELGYPYALEVPPDVLEAVRLETHGGKAAGRSRLSVPGIVVSLLALLTQVLMLLLNATTHGHSHGLELLQQVALGLIVVPPLAAIFGQVADLRRTQSLGSIGMTLQGLVWLFLALMIGGAGLAIVLIPWYLPLTAAYLMRSKTEDEKPE
ncbi:hypothetical protein K8638_22250 [Myxococcus sp. RHST-1-4]|nr:hypothetical protein [Myxococcus sp. RHSTA-1-4]